MSRAFFSLSFLWRRGFTLIEILTVVMIVGILSYLAVPVAQIALVREQEKALREALKQTRTAIDRYYEDHGHYPYHWQDLAGIDFMNDVPEPVIYLREPPENPFTRNIWDWDLVASGTTEFNEKGCYMTTAREFLAHNEMCKRNYDPQAPCLFCQEIPPDPSVLYCKRCGYTLAPFDDTPITASDIDPRCRSCGFTNTITSPPKSIYCSKCHKPLWCTRRGGFFLDKGGPWGIWDIRFHDKYPEQRRTAINDSYYHDW